MAAQLGEYQRLYELGAGTSSGLADEEVNFARIWAGKSKRVIVLDVPAAVRRDLMRFMPASDKPSRLKKAETKPAKPPPKKPEPEPAESEKPAELSPGYLRSRVWSFIQHAPSLPNGGERVGEATAAVIPWPHQVRAFERLYRDWPPKLLIADEVGLGKTIQAGMLLRQAWLAGRAKRVLVLAPKAVLKQWRIELAREVQSQLADLRRPQAGPVSLACMAWAERARCRPRVIGIANPR